MLIQIITKDVRRMWAILPRTTNHLLIIELASLTVGVKVVHRCVLRRVNGVSIPCEGYMSHWVFPAPSVLVDFVIAWGFG